MHPMQRLVYAICGLLDLMQFRFVRAIRRLLLCGCVRRLCSGGGKVRRGHSWCSMSSDEPWLVSGRRRHDTDARHWPRVVSPMPRRLQLLLLLVLLQSIASRSTPNGIQNGIAK